MIVVVLFRVEILVLGELSEKAILDILDERLNAPVTSQAVNWQAAWQVGQKKWEDGDLLSAIKYLGIAVRTAPPEEVTVRENLLQAVKHKLDDDFDNRSKET